MQILITGANRGIGKAMADRYEARGDSVHKTARNAPGHLPLDVTDPASVTALATTLGEAPLDLLVCNAGVFLDRHETLDTGYPAQQWADTFAANVTGVFLTAQALLPQLRRGQAPKIAIISSQMGSSTLAKGNGLIYRASKAAALNLGFNLASALKPEGIAVGIYHPGWVQTDMGGSAADITEADSANGLIARFDALSLATTGCFETWDGRAHPV